MAAPTTYQTALINDGPSLYYRLGEASGATASDVSGNSLAGTYVGGVSLGQAGYSNGAPSDTAVSFNGTNSYVQAPSGFNSFGSILDGSTYEFVFRGSTSSTGAVFGTFNDSPDQTALRISLEGATGKITLFIRDSGNRQREATITDTSLFNGNYHQIAFTYSSVGATDATQVLGYSDGAARTLSFNAGGTVGKATTFSNFTSPMQIGANNLRGTTNAFSNITLDEVAFFGSALTASQINNHYVALTAVPEPSVTALAVIGGLAALVFVRRRSRMDAWEAASRFNS